MADIDDVRFLIADLDPTDQLLPDSQLQAALAAEGGSVLLAAARCLEAIAVSEVLVGKKIRTQDLQTDGVAVARELREQAATLRARARDEDPDLGGFDGFDLAPVVRDGRRPEHTNDTVWGL